MDAILFSANPTMARIDDAIRHLAEHDELYWEVGYRIDRNKFVYPILGYIHICGGQVEYVATIQDIIPFSPQHYEDREFSKKVKPAPWLTEWSQNMNNCRSYHWKNALAMTHVEPFSYSTYDFQKYGGGEIRHPPQGYIRVLQPGSQSTMRSVSKGHPIQKPLTPILHQQSHLAERHLEDFVILQLQEIEPDLKLIERQLNTAAGRLDLLCHDHLGWYPLCHNE